MVHVIKFPNPNSNNKRLKEVGLENELESSMAELKGIENHIKIISSAYDPSQAGNPIQKGYWAVSDSFLQYILIFYMSSEDKQVLINRLLRRLPTHLGILLEIRPKTDGNREEIDIENYLRSTFIIDADESNKGYKKKFVSPSLSKSELRQHIKAIRPKEYVDDFWVEALSKHPVISALLGLRNVKEYRERVFGGKFPYILVDTNPENAEFDINEIKNLFQNKETKQQAYDRFFYLANAVYGSDIDRFIRQQAVPVLFLASKNEARGIVQLIYNFYDDTASRFCVGKGKDERGWLSS